MRLGLRSAIGPMKSHDLEAGGAVRPSQRSRAWRTPWPGSGRPPPAARLRGRGIAYASASSIAAQQCLALAQRARQDLNLRPLAPEAPGQYRQITGFCLQNRGFSRYRPRSIRADLGPFLGPIGPREALRGPINPDTGRLGSRTDRRRRALARLSSATPRQSVSNLDQWVTQWMSVVTSTGPSARKASVSHDAIAVPSSACSVKVHSDGVVTGVAPADSTGKPAVSCWPGGRRDGRERDGLPTKPRVPLLMTFSCDAATRFRTIPPHAVAWAHWTMV